MRIPGYFNIRFWPPAPFIRVTVQSKSLRIRRPIHFHIDTGASVTILLDKDTKYLGIDVRKLKRAERPLGGLGGTIDTYLIEDASLFLMAEEGEVVEEKLRLYVGTHEKRRLSQEEKALITRMPSLLGRDVIHRFKLVCDKDRNEIYLER